MTLGRRLARAILHDASGEVYVIEGTEKRKERFEHGLQKVYMIDGYTQRRKAENPEVRMYLRLHQVVGVCIYTT